MGRKVFVPRDLVEVRLIPKGLLTKRTANDTASGYFELEIIFKITKKPQLEIDKNISSKTN